MMRKVIKILVTIVMFIMIINIFGINSSTVYADMEFNDDPGTSGGAWSSTGMTDVAKNPSIWYPSSSTSSTLFEDKVKVISSTVWIIGMIVSVMTLMIIGIKFMFGSVEEKAQYKQTMIPWLIGAILVFAMATLPTIIYNFAKNTLN